MPVAIDPDISTPRSHLGIPTPFSTYLQSYSRSSKRSIVRMSRRLHGEPEQISRANTSKKAAKSWKEKVQSHAAPPGQEERYLRTRERVKEVAHSILGYGGNAARDVLEIGSNMLSFGPVDGLGSAADTLLYIWNALELVESNQLACLSLTERCVDTLLILRDEIGRTGKDIENELRHPMKQLNQSFNDIKKLLEAQAHLPFYKRYLKRREIQQDIEECDAKLSNALETFSLKIQIRSLKRMEEAEERRSASELRTRRDLEKIIDSLPEKVKEQEKLSLSGVITVADIEPEPMALKSVKTTAEVREEVHDLAQKNYSRDFALDLAEVRNLIRGAVENPTDETLLEVLQIKREDIPQVLEELQRALDEVRKDEMKTKKKPGLRSLDDEVPVVSVPRVSTMPTRLGEKDISDDLDRAFIEHSIKALRRRKSF